ncbi:hypothetical protein NliqN6_0251 [Naganishia liquefaciens]|uniref:Uncharacterized protein n=1 Tax=Naganishia liquefaciens TaxID=104408 RepID=A0A8H3TN13_9TREE|nr:hypothetical protein NliqN6_0251 [Naganishia liquefaciens]
MLAPSASSIDNAIPLPELAKDLLRLFRILTGKIGAVDAMQIDFADSATLSKLAKKYDFEASFRLWMICMLQRFIKSNATECFVIVCEQSSADTILAHAAILCFSIGSKPFEGVRKIDWENRAKLHIQRIGPYH